MPPLQEGFWQQVPARGPREETRPCQQGKAHVWHMPSKVQYDGRTQETQPQVGMLHV